MRAMLGRNAPDDPIALARQHGTACIERLAEILDSDNAAAAVEAAKLLLAYGHGLPVQPLSFDTTGITIEVSAPGEPHTPHHHPNGETGTSWAAC
jgi:hypothetical protein